MTSVRIGIVAEGPSDLVVIRTLLGKYFQIKGIPNVELSFVNLQPHIDNTSKSGYSEGGWLMVYKWCLANPPQLRNSIFFEKPIFAGDMDAFHVAGIVVHIDADICSELSDLFPGKELPANPCAPEIRGEYVKSALASWLWSDGGEIDGRHILCPAVESTEAWLVAGLSDEANPEAIEDVQRLLAQLDYSVVKGKVPPEKIKKPNKKIENYRNIAAVASIEVERIAERCKHFRDVATQLVELVGAEVVS